jgi:hypothetical protein
MFDTGLTAYWIEPASPHGPLGIGVTAWSIDDALRIASRLGYGIWLPDDRSQVRFTTDVQVHTLDPYVRRHMGPIVVRGLWYPFISVGVPPWTDA